jgi:hypothetical protein
MRWWAICGVAVGLFGEGGVGAHGQGGPTDNELYAAYCKGVTDQQLAGRPAGDWGREITERENQRFTAYLLSTGALTDTRRDTLGLVTAINRGKADQTQCMADFNACSQRVADSLRQNKISQKQADTMLGSCFSTAECTRAARCGGTDKLPF